jgi:hypothetical protein
VQVNACAAAWQLDACAYRAHCAICTGFTSGLESIIHRHTHCQMQRIDGIDHQLTRPQLTDLFFRDFRRLEARSSGQFLRDDFS